MKFALKITSEFLKDYKMLVIIFLLFTILAYPLESIAIPQIYSKFFESLSSKGDIKKKIIYYLTLIAVLLIVVKISDGVIHYVESIIIPKFNEFILNYIYRNLLIKYQNNYTDLELGKLVSRINTIPTIMRELSTDITIWVFPKLIAILIINAYFFYLNPYLGLVSVLAILGIFSINYFMSKKCIPSSNLRHHLLEKNSEEVQNKLNNLFSIYSSGNVNNEIKEYYSKTNKYSNKYKENLECINTIRYMNGIFDVLLFVLLNGFTAYLYLNKKISFGLLMAIFITVIYYLPCISTISSSLPDLIHYLGVLNETDTFLEEIYKQDEKIKKKPVIKLNSGKIEFKNLNFGYNSNSLLFKNFNLTIQDKQKVCIVGHSGNGKSTLIKLLMGYYHVDDNSVFLDGTDINQFDLNSLRSQISFVNQNNKLFNGSIYQNIQYGNNLSKEDIDKLIVKLEVENIYANLHDGLESDVGIGGDKLSGGQKQLVHILRAFGNKNKIIVLDEPTGAIDPENKQTILKVLKELSKNSTMILITHDESIMNMCDRIIKIDKGRIVSDKVYQS